MQGWEGICPLHLGGNPKSISNIHRLGVPPSDPTNICSRFMCVWLHLCITCEQRAVCQSSGKFLSRHSMFAGFGPFNLPTCETTQDLGGTTPIIVESGMAGLSGSWNHVSVKLTQLVYPLYLLKTCVRQECAGSVSIYMYTHIICICIKHSNMYRPWVLLYWSVYHGIYYGIYFTIPSVVIASSHLVMRHVV